MRSNQTRTAMTISMYQASAPRFASMLRNLSAILDKAQAYCEAKKIEPAVLTGSRLYPDMFPLSRQVQIACDTAKGAVARLDRKSTRLNSSHGYISYAVFCLKKKKQTENI